MRSRRSVAQQVLLLQVALVAVLVLAGTLAAVVEARTASTNSARQRVLAVADTLARAPGTVAAVTSGEVTAQLQPLTLELTRSTGVDFIVVMSPQGVRYTHPDPTQIGGQFIGHTAPAVAGRSFTETYTGTLGPSVRAVAPVRDSQGRVVGLVAVGITTERISAVLYRQLPIVLGIAAAALLLAIGGAVLVSRRLRRQTLGLGPVEITRLYEHHDAVLHAMREGLLVLDRSRRLLLANDEAVRLLALAPGSDGRQVSDLGLERSLAEALQDGRTMHDETHLSGGHVLAVNQVPARRDGRLLGSVVTLRDHTELRAIAGELDSVRGFAEALRAQAHEAANRLHSVVTLIELGREQDAVRFATTELALTAELSDRLLNTVREPVLAALLLGKTAQARERGVDMSVSEATQVGPLSLDVRDLVTVLGNLVDNAIDAAAVAPQPRSVEVMLRTDARQLTIQVRDSGPGIELENLQAVFTRGWSTKQATGPHGRGLGLALVRQVVNRHGGTIEVRTDAGAVFEVRLPMSVAEADPVLSSRVAGQ